MDKHHALLKRLAIAHGKTNFIREEIRKMEAGVRGENRVLQKLGELRLTGNFSVFSDVRLHLGEWKVQIDCLILTSRCCIIIESKNMSGDLYFKAETEEFYKVDTDGEETSYPNPYYQLMRHIRFMKEFLHETLPEMKVTGAIIMTAKSYKIHDKPAHYPIFKLESMIEKILQMYGNSPELHVSDSRLLEIGQMIIEKKSTFSYAPLCEYYHISPLDLLPGVECPNCGALGMIRFIRTWKCPTCNKNSLHAHTKTVQAYFWLIKENISNKEFREFCKVESIYAASRMLSNMDLDSNKGGAWRYYTPKKDR